jgi:hypothetical protein
VATQAAVLAAAALALQLGEPIVGHTADYPPRVCTVRLLCSAFGIASRWARSQQECPRLSTCERGVRRLRAALAGGHGGVEAAEARSTPKARRGAMGQAPPWHGVAALGAPQPDPRV